MTLDGPELGSVGIRRRVYLLMATGIFFPLAVMAATGMYWLRAIDDRVLAGRLSAAAAVAAHYDEHLSGDLEALQRLASALSPTFGDADLSDDRRALRDAQGQFRFRERLFLLDGEQNVLAEEPMGPVSLAPRLETSVVADVLRTGVPRMSGLVVDERGHFVHELVPVRRLDGRVAGVVGGTFDPERREFDRMLRHLRRGESGFAELVDSDGLVLASTVAGRVGKRSECAAHLGALVKAKRSESVGCVSCHRYEGADVEAADEFLTFAPLASAPWGVVMRQPVKEALPTEGAVPWLGVAVVLGLQLALAGAFAWGAARSVTRPIAVLTDEAERIAGGDLAWPIPELGADELGRLGASLEVMRRNLKELLEHEVEVNAELEQRVAERTKELNGANALLREREEARAQLLRKLISAQEDERKRIARELHDETSQDLAVLAMGIEAAQDALRGGRTPHLDEVKAVAVRTLEDVHRIILDLRPSVLDDLGLLSAIRWYAERHLETRGVAVRCEFGELDRRLPLEMETALFRICQEAMSNIARHAKATAVLVQVGVEDDEIRIEIEDDGRGFDLEGAARREGRRPWGLLGIRERAEILGGTARIDSAPGKGTRVLVRIPVAAMRGGAAEEPASAAVAAAGAGRPDGSGPEAAAASKPAAATDGGRST
ncbi:ATP-binding protein [Anaeromyxobacter oryzisoli]|uniref:ATP-binding protein n=1 Tax=Anaeromyxobacter oryzisoli TaxID=2925408 RepID=UPI001F594D37|nr:ATP-binding protein [Anaeromyxobacter sp. SG63]